MHELVHGPSLTEFYHARALFSRRWVLLLLLAKLPALMDTCSVVRDLELRVCRPPGGRVPRPTSLPRVAHREPHLDATRLFQVSSACIQLSLPSPMLLCGTMALLQRYLLQYDPQIRLPSVSSRGAVSSVSEYAATPLLRTVFRGSSCWADMTAARIFLVPTAPSARRMYLSLTAHALREGSKTSQTCVPRRTSVFIP